MGHARERAYRKERAERERQKLRRIPLNMPGFFSADPRYVNNLPGVFENVVPPR